MQTLSKLDGQLGSIVDFVYNYNNVMAPQPFGVVATALIP